MFGGMCVVSWIHSYAVFMCVTVQYVMLLFDCIIATCLKSFGLCYVLINCFMFF